MPANKRRFRIPAGVTLRECSVVIVGSTCKICGRDFKCKSDVIVHKRWRHNATIGPLIESLNNENFLDIGQNCDICGMYFVNISNLIIHKRLIHKHGRRKNLRKRTVHVIFKLQGVTIMDVNLDRKYLEMQENLKYVVDANTQTPNWFEKHSDDCATNIDLFLQEPIVDESHIEYGMRPQKANRYIEEKFTSTKDDTIACSTNMMGRSLAKSLLNISHKNTIPYSDDSYKKYENLHASTSKEHTNVLLGNLTVHDKENSQRIDNADSKEQEKKKGHCEILDDSKEFAICQSNKSNQVVSSISTQKSWSNKNRYDPIRQPNKVVGYKKSTGLISSAETVIDNENNFDSATKKHTLLARANGKNESLKVDSDIDDDIQEVLRITRGNVQNDINHESPNRMEREMLVQNCTELYMLSVQGKSSIYPEKCNAGFTTNVESNHLPFTTITESSYQFLAFQNLAFGTSLPLRKML